MVLEIERVRPMDELRLGGCEECPGARWGLCCCRIRRRPERPKPWSWSVMMGALEWHTRDQHYYCGGGVLQSQVRRREHQRPNTDLVRASYSAAAAPASNENRILAFSEVSPEIARFPVLRFLGSCNGRASLLLPRSSPSLCVSASGIKKDTVLATCQRAEGDIVRGQQAKKNRNTRQRTMLLVSTIYV